MIPRYNVASGTWIGAIRRPARGSAAEVHDRMPLVLTDQSLKPWLDPELSDRDTIRRFVRHALAEAFTHWAVSQRMNKLGAGEEDETLLNPA